jgi:polar amino acid transport system substrate-binding protein
MKSPIRVVVVVILAITFLALSCGGPGKNTELKESTLDKVKKEGVLRVGYIPWPPTTIKDPTTGKLSGNFIDAIEYLTAIMNVKLEYVEVSWTTFAGGLQSGDFDLAITTTFATIPRAMNVSFTHPLFYFGSSAIVRKDDKRFATLEDIDKDSVVVAVTQGEAGHEYAQANFKHATLDVIDSPDLNLAFTEVSVGRADVALGDAWSTKKYVSEHPEVKDLFANNPYNVTPICWAVRYGDNEWLNFINTAIDYMDSTGMLVKWEQKHDAHFLHKPYTWEQS